jgi:two-component system, cell cycle response regulator
MRSGGQTTVIQRILEKRAHKPSQVQEDTSATIAVMLRVLPPPRTLLVFEDALLRDQCEGAIAENALDTLVVNEPDALRALGAEFYPLVVTDNLELIRKIRARQKDRAPYVLYVAEIDEGQEREAGLIAGADDCVGRRAPEREINARIAIGRRIAELETVLRITLVENRKLSTTDDLTRVASRRFFTKHLPREVDRAARYGRALSLILCDIDHFKNVNDTLGHAGGDEVLRQFGARLQEVLRRGVDWVARIGGEEFAIVLPETSYEHALEAARKLRSAIADTAFPVQSRSIEITASFGLCGLEVVPPGARKVAESLVRIADAALYRSKRSGRNRVTATKFPSAHTEKKRRTPPAT